MIVETGGEQELFDEQVEFVLVRRRVPGGAVARIEDEVERGARVMADEVATIGAENAAIVLPERGRQARRGPLPFRRQSEATAFECALDAAQRPLGIQRMAFRALRENGRRRERRRQRAPEEHVAVDVNEGAVLQAVGDQLAERPPVGVDVAQTVELGRDFAELEA